MITTFLKDHYSEDSAYLIKDYPIGFSLRGQKKIWIETKKAGQRIVSRTTDKHGAWCKPKASNYALMQFLYIDEKGHVQSTSITEYTKPINIKGFLDRIDQLDEKAQPRLRAIAEAGRRMEPGKWHALDRYIAALNSDDATTDDMVIVVADEYTAVLFHNGEELWTEYMRYAKSRDSEATTTSILSTTFAHTVAEKQPRHLVVMDKEGTQSFYVGDGVDKEAAKELIREALTVTTVVD